MRRRIAAVLIGTAAALSTGAADAGAQQPRFEAGHAR